MVKDSNAIKKGKTLTCMIRVYAQQYQQYVANFREMHEAAGTYSIAFIHRFTRSDMPCR